MQIGVIGLGRMGANMTLRWLAGGHECVVYARHADAVAPLRAAGAVGTESLAQLVARLRPPRAVWIMIPAAAVDDVVAELSTLLERDDVIVDGGNSHYADDLRRAQELALRGLHYLDVGVSGGIWGREHGYCQMIGGDPAIVARLEPVFATLAPGRAGRPAGRANPHGTAGLGYLHCGPSGAGHFVKMVHNGIEYGLMAAYAEGLNLLKNANAGRAAPRVDAETSPLKAPERLAYDFDLAAIAEVWKHGSVIRSWLLDLTASALTRDPGLERFEGRVADSGEGRWTIGAAIDAGVPVPVLATALFARLTSRDAADFANRVLSAMRLEFGGHAERSRDRAGSGR
jgi:6-phosphogluconate dehydrogenase